MGRILVVAPPATPPSCVGSGGFGRREQSSPRGIGPSLQSLRVIWSCLMCMFGVGSFAIQALFTSLTCAFHPRPMTSRLSLINGITTANMSPPLLLHLEENVVLSTILSEKDKQQTSCPLPSIDSVYTLESWAANFPSYQDLGNRTGFEANTGLENLTSRYFNTNQSLNSCHLTTPPKNPSLRLTCSLKDARNDKVCWKSPIYLIKLMLVATGDQYEGW